LKYAVEMGSGAMIYITRFHKDWFRYSKVDWGGDTHRDIQTVNWPHKPTFIFSKKESGLMTLASTIMTSMSMTEPIIAYSASTSCSVGSEFKPLRRDLLSRQDIRDFPYSARVNAGIVSLFRP
jgi:hypothetical protein